MAIDKSKHRLACKILFGLILIAVLALIAVLIVQTRKGVPPMQRGAAGELTRPAQSVDRQALPAPKP